MSVLVNNRAGAWRTDFTAPLPKSGRWGEVGPCNFTAGSALPQPLRQYY
jgi:hypothetical protein